MANSTSKSRTTYAAKLLDPRWQRRRLERLQAADFACELCDDRESTLHVHHKAYLKGRDPWEYEVSQLAVLCDECHKAQHEKMERLNLAVSQIDTSKLGYVVGYALSLASLCIQESDGAPIGVRLKSDEEIIGASDFFHIGEVDVYGLLRDGGVLALNDVIEVTGGVPL